MNTNKFLDYIRRNYNLHSETYRLVIGIVNYVSDLPVSNEEKCKTLITLLKGIDVTEAEIQDIAF